MQILFFIGRVIFGVYWLGAAYGHLVGYEGTVGYAASKGVPAPKTAIIVTGLLLLIGGLSILTGYYPTIGIVALVVFLLGVTFKIHAFWKEQDPMMKMSQKIHFQKNIALLGALLMMLAIAQPWMWSL
jgi:uncharacterized membrane protein YphA (DoxX/SURF4 family)